MTSELLRRLTLVDVLAPHISGGLNTVLAGQMRAAGFAVNLSLPSRAERDAWVAAFLAPLLG